MLWIGKLVATGLAALLWGGVAVAGTLEDVRERGHLACGVSGLLPGFVNQSADGRQSGLSIDICRAIAAAVLGDADKVVFTRVWPKERFLTLQTGELDVLTVPSGKTLENDSAHGVDFPGVYLYDGQGFLVRKDIGLSHAKELEGAIVCTLIGTVEIAVQNFFKTNDMNLRLLTFGNPQDMLADYDAGKCDAITTDRSILAALRMRLENPSAHTLLPDIFSLESTGPVVRHDDSRWSDVVTWTVFALIRAEELSVTSANVDDMRSSPDHQIQRLLGTSNQSGAHLGLADDWAYQIIKQVGNYGEVYDRTIGQLGLERGMNALLKDGGLQFAMPF